MAVEIEAARLMVWRAAAAADSGDFRAGALYAPAAKTFAVDTAIRCAERAVKILGSYGITREYPAARMLNDAWIGDSCDGTRDMLRLNIVTAMRMAAGGGPSPGH
jgi:alkylation response protein AidB-like acyl-CoA dehydrogenase